MSNQPQVTMPSRAWYGDVDLTLAFPQAWRVTVLEPWDAPALSPSAMERAFAEPIGTGTIAEMARGRKSAAIVVDDISRPTPAAVLLPTVLAQLDQAGIPQGQITIVIGGGSHRTQTAEEIDKKVGADVAATYRVVCHDFMAGDHRGLGELADGLPIYINRHVADAEFKMTVGGIYPHGSVGFGGGSKLILPGVSAFATMFHFHTFYTGRGQGNIENQGGGPDNRDISEAVARHVGLDMVVNCVINSRRQVAGLFVGDFVQAHRAGARFAKEIYATPIPNDVRQEADLVVVNAYPLDSDPIQLSKALWARRYFRPEAYTIAVDPAVDGICYHGLFQRTNYRRYLAQWHSSPPPPDPQPCIGDPEQVLIWSEGFRADEFVRQHPNGLLHRGWDSLIQLLSPHLPQEATVALFPVSGVQILG